MSTEPQTTFFCRSKFECMIDGQMARGLFFAGLAEARTRYWCIPQFSDFGSVGVRAASCGPLGGGAVLAHAIS